MEPGLEIGAGTHHLLCSTVEDRGQSAEEVLVFASRERNPMVEEWLADLRDVRDELDPGVPYETAMTMLDNLGAGTRGTSPREISAEKREALFGNLSSEVFGGEEELQASGLRRFWIACKFKRPN